MRGPSNEGLARGHPRKRTAAMVSEAVRRSASWSGCGANGEGGAPWPEGSSAAATPWEPIAAEGLQAR